MTIYKIGNHVEIPLRCMEGDISYMEDYLVHEYDGVDKEVCLQHISEMKRHIKWFLKQIDCPKKDVIKFAKEVKYNRSRKDSEAAEESVQYFRYSKSGNETL